MGFGPRQASPAPGRRYSAAFLTTLGLFAALALWPFLALGWLPLDEGIYGWNAQRMADGALPHRELLISQPGYVAYLNLVAWQWFGQDLLALRYPMLLLTAAIAVFTALLLPIRDRLSALGVVVIVVGLGFPQFSVPSPSWYCLTLSLAFAWLMASPDTATRPNFRRVFVAGVIAGVCVGVRQISGGLLVIAGLCILALQPCMPNGQSRLAAARWLGPLALAATGALVPAYLYFTHSPAAIYWGLPALAVLGLVTASLWRRRSGFDSTSTGLFITGCASGFLPLLSVHLLTGTLPEFLYQITVGAGGYVSYGEMRAQSFGLVLQDALELLTTDPSAPSVASGLFLLLLLAMPAGLLWLMWRAWRQGRGGLIDPVLICASLFVVVCIAFQSYLYMFYVVPLVVAAMIRATVDGRLWRQRLAVGATAAVAVFALVTYGGRVSGEVLGRLYRGTQAAQIECNLPRCPFRAAPVVREQMARELAELQRVEPHRPLLVLPTGAPYYLMLSNPTPWRWSSVNPAANSDAEQAALLRQLSARPNTVIAMPHEPTKGRPVSRKLLRALCPSDIPDGKVFAFYQPCGSDSVRSTDPGD